MPVKEHLLRMDEITFVGLVDKGANQDADFLIYKRSTNPTEGERSMSDTFDPTKLPEDGKAAWEALEKRATDAETKVGEIEPQLTELTAKVETLEKAQAKPPTEEDVLKSLDPAARALVEKLQADAESAIAKANEADQIAKATAAKAELTELTAIAKNDLSELEGETGEQAALLQKCKVALDGKDYDRLLGIMKTASNTLKESGLLKAIGKDGEGSGDGTAWSAIVAKAGELQKVEAGLTHAQAVSKVMDAEPTLYEEYLAEQRGASN